MLKDFVQHTKELETKIAQYEKEGRITLAEILKIPYNKSIQGQNILKNDGIQLPEQIDIDQSYKFELLKDLSQFAHAILFDEKKFCDEIKFSVLMTASVLKKDEDKREKDKEKIIKIIDNEKIHPEYDEELYGNLFNP